MKTLTDLIKDMIHNTLTVYAYSDGTFHVRLDENGCVKFQGMSYLCQDDDNEVIIEDGKITECLFSEWLDADLQILPGR